MCTALKLLPSTFNRVLRKGPDAEKGRRELLFIGHLFYARDKEGVDRKVTSHAEKGSGDPSLPMLSFFWILYLRSAA